MVTIFLKNRKPKQKRNAPRDKTFPKNVKGSFIRELHKENGIFKKLENFSKNGDEIMMES